MFRKSFTIVDLHTPPFYREVQELSGTPDLHKVALCISNIVYRERTRSDHPSNIEGMPDHITGVVDPV